MDMQKPASELSTDAGRRTSRSGRRSSPTTRRSHLEQLSIYAHSVIYDPATGERTPVELEPRRTLRGCGNYAHALADAYLARKA